MRERPKGTLVIDKKHAAEQYQDTAEEIRQTAGGVKSQEICEKLLRIAKRYDLLAKYVLRTRRSSPAKIEIESCTHAMKILKDAAHRCGDEEMQTPEVGNALDYLTHHVPKARIDRFRQKLNIFDPLVRKSCVLAAYDALERHLTAQPAPEA